MKREVEERDGPEMIEEKAGPLLIMVPKEGAKNTEEALQTEEQKRNRHHQTDSRACES